MKIKLVAKCVKFITPRELGSKHAFDCPESCSTCYPLNIPTSQVFVIKADSNDKKAVDLFNLLEIESFTALDKIKALKMLGFRVNIMVDRENAEELRERLVKNNLAVIDPRLDDAIVLVYVE